MIVMQIAILAIVAASGGAVVFTRRPGEQVVGASFFGLMLALMFFIFQAPDVALSQLVIGAVALPLMVLLAIAKTRSTQMQQDREREQQRNKEREHGRRGGTGGNFASPDDAGAPADARQPPGRPREAR
ncbi:MAG: hypothetical protein JWO87_3339 [Phycisphaerales bacterium]|nr:hypothetical protein [Phycisphaerales bacterium]MDB5304338.1 hypothetical protein [Phycisphaerales bacterium]